jgi:hypothetical protein
MQCLPRNVACVETSEDCPSTRHKTFTGIGFISMTLCHTFTGGSRNSTITKPVKHKILIQWKAGVGGGSVFNTKCILRKKKDF